MSDRQYYVYLLANRKHGTLYCGVTNDLVRRVHEHREGLVEGFTLKHGLNRLVWFETHSNIESAIAREKIIKRWRRSWKFDLIEADNPIWIDLFEGLV